MPQTVIIRKKIKLIKKVDGFMNTVLCGDPQGYFYLIARADPPMLFVSNRRIGDLPLPLPPSLPLWLPSQLSPLTDDDHQSVTNPLEGERGATQ